MAPSPTTLRIAGDARLMAGAGYALLLQVAHPVVSAGVAEHSNFQEDPYGRLVRTLDYVNVSVFGSDEAAAEMGRRTREMHKRIKGVMPDGTRYHSLEPGPFAWVHATLVHSILEVARAVRRAADAGRARDRLRRLARDRRAHRRPRPRPAGDLRRVRATYVADMERDRARGHGVGAHGPAHADAPEGAARPLHDRWRLEGDALAGARAARLLDASGCSARRVRARLGLAVDAARSRSSSTRSPPLHRAASPGLPRTAREFGPTYLRYRRAGARAAGLRGVMTTAALARALTAEIPADSDHILDAALALAAASGLRHLTMEDVARRAGVGRMTVYRRFGSRDALLDALAGREARRCLAELDAASPIDAPLEDAGGRGLRDRAAADPRAPAARPPRARGARLGPAGASRTSELLDLCTAFLTDRLTRMGVGAPTPQLAELLVRVAISFILLPGHARRATRRSCFALVQPRTAAAP